MASISTDSTTKTGTQAATNTLTGTNTRTNRNRRIFAILSGLTALGIILQGLWAGIFLSYDERPDSWIEIHDAGAWVTLTLAILSAAWAVWKLRGDKALWIASVALAIIVAGEAHLGGTITDQGNDGATAIHVPVAMVLLALSVWLPMRARRNTSA